MMNKMLQDLYHGRIPGWDSQVHSDSLTETIGKEIQNQRKYLKSIISPKAFEQFRVLEKLHKKKHNIFYENVRADAFRLGVLLMCAVFMEGAEE